jgi:hypothetical protein
MLFLISIPLTLSLHSIQELSVDPIPKLSTSSTYTSSYSITTNEDNQTIFAALTSPLPPNIKLTITLEAPDGAKSLGPISLSEEPKPLVMGISRVAAKKLRITYSFSKDTLTPSGDYLQSIRFFLENSHCK